MSMDFYDRKSVLYLKNQLINGDLSKLKQMYSQKDNYAFYIYILAIVLDEEPPFFLIDDQVLLKATAILNNKRFDYRTKEISQAINEIIVKINTIQCMSDEEKKRRCHHYTLWQQQERQTVYTSKEDFLGGLAYDALLITQLYNEDLTDVDPVYFMASTNYLIKNLPEIYLEDTNRLDLTLNLLDKHAKKRWIWNWAERNFAKEAIKNIQKIKKQGE